MHTMMEFGIRGRGSGESLFLGPLTLAVSLALDLLACWKIVEGAGKASQRSILLSSHGQFFSEPSRLDAAWQSGGFRRADCAFS